MSESTVTMELACGSDAETLGLMSRDLVEAGLDWAWTPARISGSIRDEDTVVLVARSGGDIAGFAIMYFGPDEARLNLLAVEPGQRRRGIGRGLVRWLEKSAVTAGISVAYLEMRSSSSVARHFYHALGYLPVETLPDYYQRQETALRMARDLWD